MNLIERIGSVFGFLNEDDPEYQLECLTKDMMRGFAEISSILRKGVYHHADSHPHLHPHPGTVNSSGDDQKSLDIIANDLMIKWISWSGACGAIISEENEEPIVMELPSTSNGKRGRYLVAIDPLDGSSNIECNVAVGTIFAIWELSEEKRRSSPTLTKEDLLMPAKEILLAGYCIYGTSTELVMATPFENQAPYRYIMDPDTKRFTLIDKNFCLPPLVSQKRIYSINEGNHASWDDQTDEGIARIKAHSDPSPYSLRYVGSMVSDVHRTLLYGGIFLYPADKKTGKGKLRLLYEAFPMALIMEAANGVAIAGPDGMRILDIVPTEIHQKCSVVLGGKRDVDLFCGSP